MDIYRFHKLALVPLLQKPQDSLAAVMELSAVEKEQFVNFIRINGLAVMWHQLLKEQRHAVDFPQKLLKRLESLSMKVVAAYLMQKHMLEQVATIFVKESIVHAIFKGAHIREIIYSQPSVRPSCDIDVLIHPSDMTRAVKVLVGAGFSLEVKQQNISHELTLMSRNVSIDLHWHILRPGRLRTSLTDEFLSRRHDYGSHVGFDAETTLFLMLVHPVFTKYSTTSLAALVRFVDLLRWIQQQDIDWDSLLLLLESYGVKTAAWITAVYLQEVTGETLPPSFLRKIEPSRLKQRYLKGWISSNRAGRLYSHPLLIQLGFTIPAHDSVCDAIRFLKTLGKEQRQAQARMDSLSAAIGQKVS